jgi:hypothetical protein
MALRHSQPEESYGKAGIPQGDQEACQRPAEVSGNRHHELTSKGAVAA